MTGLPIEKVKSRLEERGKIEFRDWSLTTNYAKGYTISGTSRETKLRNDVPGPG